MTDLRAARAIADAVFYEGFLLYPYTASAPKNKLRWQFGVVAPRAQAAAATGEYGHQQTDVWFEAGDDARIDLLFRFLHVQTRRVEARRGDDFVPVAALTVAGTPHLTFDETCEREIAAVLALSSAPAAEFAIAFPGGHSSEDLRDAAGVLAGRVVRERWPVSGTLRVETTAADGVRRLRIRVENSSEVVPGPERGMVTRTAFVSAHTLAGITNGSFWSPIDPPDPSRAALLPAVNEHTWPVLVGDSAADERRASIVLSSPIILSDFPAIAPNTSADAFDATEIDELLNLSVLSLSDAERAEARATDPRARAIVERAEAFDAQDVARTHAAAHPVPTVFGAPGMRDEAPPPMAIDVAGVAVAKGSSVRLAPKRRADAWDMFLAGKTATVQAIHQDFEDKIYVAVTIDDDPASEYHQWYGRSFFFAPDEVEPLGAPA